MKRVTFLLFAFLFTVGSVAHAQSKMPSKQFGFGMFVGPLSGVSLTYAANQNIHVGADIALQLTTANGASSTTFGLQPFFRYVLPGNVNPFVEAGLPVIVQNSSTNVGLSFGGGLAYGVSQNFVVDFDLGMIGVIFTNGGAFNFGFSNITVGGKWFF